MNEENHTFEAFLREFEPRRPRPLPPAAIARHSWQYLAAAAMLILAIGSVWFWMRHRRGHPNGAAVAPPADTVTNMPPNQAMPPSTLALTQSALQDGAEFDRQLDSIARRSLPGFTQKDSTLRVLAKE